MTGTPLLAVAFLAAFIYALTVCKAKWKIAFLVLGTMAAVIGLALGMSLFVLTPAAMGTLGGIAAQITGIAASLILARREPNPAS